MNGKKKFSAIFKMTCFLTYKELICMKWKTHSLNTQVYVFKPFPGNSFLWHQSLPRQGKSEHFWLVTGVHTKFDDVSLSRCNPLLESWNIYNGFFLPQFSY